MGILSKEIWEKVFKDEWAKWHLIGYFIIGISFLLILSLTKITDSFLFTTILILFILSMPIITEFWDKYKIGWNDPIVKVRKWNWIEKAIFTSDQVFDKQDLVLDYIGYFIAILIFVPIFKLFF